MMATTDEETGSVAEMAALTPSDERPPPPPPKETTHWPAAKLPSTADAPLPALPTPGLTRLKKKVLWKGKNIMVLLPWDDDRGQNGKAPAPMSQREVEAMLKEWEQLGYNTKGFNLGQSHETDDEGGEGQSRSPWPHEADISRERDQKSFQVSIPDRRGKIRMFLSHVTPVDVIYGKLRVAYIYTNAYDKQNGMRMSRS
jgi:hypothetical protein